MGQEFRVKARTLFHLGAELITTDTIALNELIKNAFDAHSEEVRIHFHIPFNPALARHLAEQVSAGTISRQRAVERLKAALAEELSKEDSGDLRVRLDSLPKNANAFSHSLRELADKVCTISIKDWGDGMSRGELLSIFLVIGTPVKYLKKRDSSSVTPILGDKGIGRLSMMRLGRYATVISATKDSPRNYKIDFDWAKFEDPELFLHDIMHEVVAAGPKESSQESGTLIEISGLYSKWFVDDVLSFIAYLRRLQDPFISGHKRFPIKVFRNAQSQPIARINKRLVESAQFEAHFSFQPGGHDDAIALERRLRWKGETTFVKREWTVNLLCHDLEASIDDLKALGALRVGCYWYNRSQLSHPTGEWDVQQIRKELNVWSGGFAIYRDGFRIGLTGSEEGDWMRMGSDALRGTGFRLNNIQTIGAIALTYADNSALIDTTNREDLVDCPEYRLLSRLMKVIVIEDLRFVIQTYTEAESKSALVERTSEVSMKRAADDIQSTLKQVGNLISKVPTNVKPNVISIRNSLKEHVDYIRTIQKSVQFAQERKVEILELAGIGMSVEIIAHELARVTKRTADLLGQITSVSDEKKLEKLVESIESQLISVNKRLRAIDPFSPSGRNRKVKFDLVAFVSGILEGYAPRFERHHVTASLTVDGRSPRQAVNVRMVRGFIAQVVENLLSNSMYWLCQVPLAPGSIRRIEIDIDRHGRFVEICDSGPGIDPGHREDVFKPYFTYKKNGKGLGLYIARELTEYHGGKLFLSEDAEGDGRLRSFILEFPKG